MERGQSGHHVVCDPAVIREQGRNKRPAALLRQRDGFVIVLIRHHGCDRSEGLDRVDSIGDNRIGATQQHRSHERALLRISGNELDAIQRTGHDFRFSGENTDLGFDIFAVFQRNQRAHARVLIVRQSNRCGGKTPGECINHGVFMCVRHDDAPDRGAFLSRLDGHFPANFLDEEVKLLRTRCSVDTENRGVETVGLHGEANRVLQDRRAGFQLLSGGRGPGEGDDVLFSNMIEEIAGRSGHDLQGTIGQDAGFKNSPHHKFGQIGGLRGGFDNAGHPGDQRRCDLFQHAPDREIEGIYVNGNTQKRGQDMLSGKGTVARERLDRSFRQHLGVRQLAPGLGSKGQERADTSLNINPSILACRASREILKIELFLLVHEFQADSLQHQRTLVNGHGAQSRTADLSAPFQRRPEVEATRADQRVDIAGRRVQHRLAVTAAPTPRPLDIAFQPARGRSRPVHGSSFPQYSGELQLSQPCVRISLPCGAKRLVVGVAEAQLLQAVEAL